MVREAIVLCKIVTLRKQKLPLPLFVREHHQKIIPNRHFLWLHRKLKKRNLIKNYKLLAQLLFKIEGYLIIIQHEHGLQLNNLNFVPKFSAESNPLI